MDYRAFHDMIMEEIEYLQVFDVSGDYQKRRKTPRFSHGDIRRKIHTPFTK